ncbi:PqqD family protein [Terriglobus sp. TAA 43]|uniref:PqqD family protein n=1 Tax=Terriglobus sp. TAA 43 TaxID=278961 RepID=UPI000646B3C0|nr:PqqD family protein [Terriglobus sp. TAA 43]
MIRIREDVRFAREGDGGVLLDLAKNRFFDLNATGADIWQHVLAGASVDQIVAVLSQETMTSPAVIEKAVGEFLQTLDSLGLVIVGKTEPTSERSCHA